MTSHDLRNPRQSGGCACALGMDAIGVFTLGLHTDSEEPMISKSATYTEESILKLVRGVKHAFETSERTESIDELISGWRELLKVVGQTGELILNSITKNEVDFAQDIVTMRMNHMTGLTQASSILASMDHVTHEEVEITKPSESFSKSTGEDEDLEEMIVSLKSLQEAHEQRCRDITKKQQLLSDALESEVEEVFDSFSSGSLVPFRSVPTEFTLVSSPEGLDDIKKSDSMRWLNDVLKWQVRDFNLQIQERREIFEIQRDIMRKKEVIKGILRDKLVQGAAIRKLHAAKQGLDVAIDGLYKISTASSTAASSPPTTASQMIQADVIKHLIDENLPECADVYPYVGY
jgi:hypothetical protein